MKKGGIRLSLLPSAPASLLLNNEESPVYVKDQPGHSSAQMTVDIKGHPIPRAHREAANSLDEKAPKRTSPK